MRRLFLIDGSSFVYRAFYAVGRLSTSKGQPTNAIYGVVTMLTKLLSEEKPELVAVAFDTGKPTFRHEAYEAYKIHRPPMPQELVSQLPWIKEVLKAWRITVLEKEGFEADDLLATVAHRAGRRGLKVLLVTADKDALQLLDRSTAIYRPTREGHEVIDEKALRERWKIAPEQVVEVMALMGDETDNIPGARGIGEKTAVELIQTFRTVEGVLKHLEDKRIRPSVAKAIRDQIQAIELSRKLALADREVPIEWDWDSLAVQEPDRARLREIFRTLEFRSLLKALGPEVSSGSVEVETAGQGMEAEGLLAQVRQAGRLSLVIGAEKTGPLDSPWFGIGLCWRPGKALAVPGDCARDAIRAVLEDPHVVKIVPRLKETLVLLSRGGFTLKPPWTDPSLASYLLDPSRASHEVLDLSLEFLGVSADDPDPLLRLGRQAEAALQLAPVLEKEVAEKGLETLLQEVEIPLAQVLAKMELTGIAVDAKALDRLSASMNKELERLTEEITQTAQEDFNINSPKQLSRILFEKLKLPVVKKTKTGASTDEEVLRRLALLHPLPTKLLEYRELSKLRSTYVEALPKLIDPADQKIHTSFNQTVTATGRLSSSDPNLQNIPIRTPLGRQIREAFVPSSPDGIFLAADYSQIELRILAHLSGDRRLIQAFEGAGDIHRETASEVFHISPEAVSDDKRGAAKTINFGILYGMTPFGLAKELGVGTDEAQEFIDRYFKRYPDVKSYLEESLAAARKKGYVTTLFNRRRYIPELTAADPTVRQFAERTAINAPIQGSAADLIKAAMVAVDAALIQRRLAARMLLTVHDELVFELPPQEEETLRELVRQVMESPSCGGKPIRLRVPIVVKVKTGSNWLEASHG